MGVRKCPFQPVWTFGSVSKFYVGLDMWLKGREIVAQTLVSTNLASELSLVDVSVAVVVYKSKS